MERIVPLSLNWRAARAIAGLVRGGRPRPQRPAMLSAFWSGAWWSLADRLQRAAHAERLRAVQLPQDPLFVVGFWRSGTTMLHELLASDPSFTTCSTEDAMRPFTLLAHPQRRVTVAARRPMDAVLVHAHSPQEEEFALLNLGLLSHYRVMLVPHRLRESLHWLCADRWSESERREWCEGYITFIRTLLAKRGGILLLKSPTNTFRMQLLLELFPRARFAYLRRAPFATIVSNLRMWKQVFSCYALTEYDEAELRQFIVTAYCTVQEHIDWARRHVSADCWHECRFEAMREDAPAELERLYARLNLVRGPAAAELQARMVKGWRAYPRTDYHVGDESHAWIEPALRALPGGAALLSDTNCG